MKKEISLSVTAFLVCTLTACGGGSSSSSPVASNPPAQTVPPTPTTPTTPPTPTVTPADLQTTVAPPTYAANSQELAFFNQLNDFRAKLGLGLVAQSAALDKSSAAHSGYIVANVDWASPTLNLHAEDPAHAGFTGATPLDRAKFAAYGGTWVGEQVTSGSGRGASTALSRLIASVYHREGLVGQYPRDFGIGVSNDSNQTIVATLGGSDGKWQRNASDYLGVYPADKQTGVGLSTYPELPNPYPEITLNEFATKTSYPVSINSERSTTLKVESFTVTEAGQSAPLDVRLITADNDPHKMLPANSAYLAGKAPFKANTVYNVSFKGTVNGAAVTKVWSFTTGQQ